MGYLSDEPDYPLMAEAVRSCWELATTPAILEHGTRVVMVNEQTLASEEGMRAYIDSAIDTAFNPIGTARMGAADDEAAVVDQYCGI
ncbi:GMC oxidoreductase [Nonomuraea sp. M3C6]|uniref:GMC oxidoreductase n=1 Tax=Nonomuraea marmarensis TaxID=3351344 RepID=A0ABW7AW61_9ACTN